MKQGGEAYCAGSSSSVPDMGFSPGRRPIVFPNLRPPPSVDLSQGDMIRPCRVAIVWTNDFVNECRAAVMRLCWTWLGIGAKVGNSVAG
jgi:hypothetical protein